MQYTTQSGHCICAECCTALLADHYISCPKCAVNTECTDISKLPKNYAMLDVMESISQADSQAKKKSQPFKHQCQNEGCSECATHSCKSCNYMFCMVCLELTHNGFLFKNHIIEDIKNRKPKCQTHNDIDADVFCETCQELICFKCHLYDGHKGHDTVGVTTVASKMKTDLQQVLSKANVLKDRLNSKQVLLSKDVQAIEESVSLSLQNVDRDFDALRDGLEKRRKETKLKINNVKQAKLSKWSNMQEKVSQASALMTTLVESIDTSLSQSDFDVVAQSKDLNASFQEGRQLSESAIAQTRINASVQFSAPSLDQALSFIRLFGAVDVPGKKVHMG